MSKTYTLELTVEELERLLDTKGIGKMQSEQVKYDVLQRVDALAKQAEADRERDDLRLPWTTYQGTHPEYSRPACTEMKCPACQGTPAMRRLVLAAPELLEAVQLVKRAINTGLGDIKVCTETGIRSVLAGCERALRKVETGVPE